MNKIILQVLDTMKKNYSSLNPKFNLNFKLFLPVLFSIIISSSLQAQEIFPLDGLQSKSAISTIQKLTEDGQNNAYFINENQINKAMSNPLIIETDIQSLNAIFQSSASLKSAEMIMIHLKDSSDLNKTIDLSKAQQFSNLKYIYIVSEQKTTANQIKNKLINTPSKVTVYYSISLQQ